MPAITRPFWLGVRGFSRASLTNEETVEQIRENAFIQFLLGFAGYSRKAAFDPSMMVRFRKRFSEEDLNHTNELIAERGKIKVMKLWIHGKTMTKHMIQMPTPATNSHSTTL